MMQHIDMFREGIEYYKILDWLSENMPNEVNDPARGHESLSEVVIKLLEKLLPEVK